MPCDPSRLGVNLSLPIFVCARASTRMSDEPITSEGRSGRILAYPNFGGLLRVEPTSHA